MKLRTELIEVIASRIVKALSDEGHVRASAPHELAERLATALTDDLMVEDRLNDEVREILRQHQDEMTRHNIDYAEMFKITKKRLIRERNLVL